MILKKIGHYAVKLVIASIAVIVAINIFLADQMYWHLGLSFFAVVVLIFAFAGYIYHAKALCEKCISELPLDAAAKAAKFKWRFTVVHAFENKVLAVGFLIVVLVSGFLVGSLPGLAVWVVVQALLVYFLLSLSSHSTLQPWCPKCKNGGDDVVIKDKDPVGVG